MRRAGIVAVSVAFLAVVTPLAVAAPPPPKPAPAVTVTAADSTTLQVDWVSSATGVDHWMIRLDDVATGLPATHVTACGTCRRARVADAVTGRSYRATVWPVDAAGLAGPTATSSAFVLGDALCGINSRVVCAAVDARRHLEPIAHRAGGLNGGWDAVTTDPERVDEVGPTSARVDVHTDAATWGELQRRGIPTTYLVDSWWRTERQALGESILPWDDIVLYELALARLAADFLAAGTLPDYWDLSNEPDVWGVYGNVIPARDQLLLQYRVGYTAIRAVIPDAKIIGPSLQGFFWDEPSRTLDLKSFIAYADANNLQFHAISWHEHGIESDLDDLWVTSGRTVASHVQRARVALAATEHLRDARVFISEVVPAWMSALPGGMTGWLTYAEGSGAEQIGLTCWPTPNDPLPGLTNAMTACGLGTFDGLFHSNGNPTSTWWPHHHYRWTLDGQRVDGRVNQLGWSALATEGDGGAVRALIARSESCRADVNPHCSSQVDSWLRGHPGWFKAGATADAKVIVATSLPAGRSVTVTATRFTPRNTTYSTVLPPVTEVSVAGTVAPNGTVTLTLPKVVDGDAWLVALTPTS